MHTTTRQNAYPTHRSPEVQRIVAAMGKAHIRELERMFAEAAQTLGIHEELVRELAKEGRRAAGHHQTFGWPLR